MRKHTALIGVLAALAAVPALATTVDYGWEDGVGTILSSFGNLVDPTNVTGVQIGKAGSLPDYTCPGANSGDRYLHVAEEPHDGTPQAYIAFIKYLTDGDIVDASFFGFDLTVDASPSLRIWAHYADSSDINSFKGSAGGNETYTAGTGWSQVAHSWTFDSNSGDRDALVIEARLYSTPSTGSFRTDYFIDDLSVTAPGSAEIVVAPEPGALLLLVVGVIALAKRR